MNREQILSPGRNPRRSRPVDVPEWGGTVHVREMSGAERDEYEYGLSKSQEAGAVMRNFRARLLVHCLYDEQGNRLFQPDDADALGEQEGTVIKRLFEVAAPLNGLSAEDGNGGK